MPKNNNNKKSWLGEANSKQNIAIAEINKDLCWLKKEFASVKHMVSNDLPHQIESLKDSFNAYKVSQSRWLVTILVTLVFTLLGLVLNLIR